MSTSLKEQQEFLDSNPCRCMVRHAMTQEEKDYAMRLVRSDKATHQQAGLLMLSECPSR